MQKFTFIRKKVSDFLAGTGHVVGSTPPSQVLMNWKMDRGGYRRADPSGKPETRLSRQRSETAGRTQDQAGGNEKGPQHNKWEKRETVSQMQEETSYDSLSGKATRSANTQSTHFPV